MQIITIGKRLIDAKQIALIEPFNPAGNPEFKPEKDYKARVILLNRDTVLTGVQHEIAKFSPCFAQQFADRRTLTR